MQPYDFTHRLNKRCLHKHARFEFVLVRFRFDFDKRKTTSKKRSHNVRRKYGR